MFVLPIFLLSPPPKKKYVVIYLITTCYDTNFCDPGASHRSLRYICTEMSINGELDIS